MIGGGALAQAVVGYPDRRDLRSFGLELEQRTFLTTKNEIQDKLESRRDRSFVLERFFNVCSPDDNDAIHTRPGRGDKFRWLLAASHDSESVCFTGRSARGMCRSSLITFVYERPSCRPPVKTHLAEEFRTVGTTCVKM